MDIKEKRLEEFANTVWEALKGDHNDLRKQQIIVKAYQESMDQVEKVSWKEGYDEGFTDCEQGERIMCTNCKTWNK